LKGQYPEKKVVGRPGLQYIKQGARNTAADSYTAQELTFWTRNFFLVLAHPVYKM